MLWHRATSLNIFSLWKKYKLLIDHIIDKAVYEVQTQLRKEDNYIKELIVLQEK